MRTARAINVKLIPLIVLLVLIEIWPTFDRADSEPAPAVVAPAGRQRRVEHPEAPVRAVPAPAVALTPADREVVEWAMSRFALVGLDMPVVEISFHDDTESCQGYDGVYEGSRLGPRVRVCIPDRGTFASTLERRRTLAHELAHAWEQANLDDDDRVELLAHLDADGWYAPEVAWEHRGAERFAETIVWRLYDQRRRPTLIDVHCRELHADFLTITGTTALGPIEPVCELDTDSVARLDPSGAPALP